MNQNVPTQAGRMKKRFRTLGALMEINHRTLAVLSIEVLPQHLTLGECLVARRTRERPLAGVHHFVALEDLLLDERPIADAALERLLAGVRAMVAHERALAGKPFLAEFAHVTAAIFVRRQVAGQLDATGERFGAGVALEDLQFAVLVEILVGLIEIADGHVRALVVGHLDVGAFGAVALAHFVLVVGLHPETGIRFDCFLREEKKDEMR